MKLSLILATVGRSSEVGRLIGTLAAQTDRRFELIVVDQNEDDRLVPHIEAGRAAGLDLQHLRLERPSLSGAR
ncbi:glycosyltransferase, partial [Acinetobacter baumannii]